MRKVTILVMMLLALVLVPVVYGQGGYHDMFLEQAVSILQSTPTKGADAQEAIADALGLLFGCPLLPLPLPEGSSRETGCIADAEIELLKSIPTLKFGPDKVSIGAAAGQLGDIKGVLSQVESIQKATSGIKAQTESAAAIAAAIDLLTTDSAQIAENTAETASEVHALALALSAFFSEANEEQQETNALLRELNSRLAGGVPLVGGAVTNTGSGASPLALTGALAIIAMLVLGVLQLRKSN